MRSVGAVVLVVLLAGASFAQEASGPVGDAHGHGAPSQGDMSGGMDPGRSMGGMQDDMMSMMMQCMDMMRAAHGNEMGSMGMGQADDMMNQAGRYDRATAEALARAFLRGRDPEAGLEILGVERAPIRYTVRYRQGDMRGTLTVDAMTGDVMLGTGE